MQIGVDSFGAVISDPATGLSVSPVQRIENLLEEIQLSDEVDLDVFGIGEHHRTEFVDSAPAVILAAAATRTKNIRLSSAVTVLSAADPVRVFQEFATLDLISHGRAEIVAGRGSSVEAFPLFGFDLDDYDSLFSEKLNLLLKIRENTRVHWSGKYRPPLNGQAVYPRPLQNPFPIWVGVGGTPSSFVRAGGGRPSATPRRKVCGSCALKHRCTLSPRRYVSRNVHEDALQRMHQRTTAEVMRMRGSTVEHPFATIKYRIF
jgi:alkanesulfonate monooxygenase SsuD/methylene tetrahydromethanopterin reductase-like flavin-dependent oxidoreductase (luciferase family)